MANDPRAILGKFHFGPADGAEMEVLAQPGAPVATVLFGFPNAPANFIYRGRVEPDAEFIDLRYIGILVPEREDE